MCLIPFGKSLTSDDAVAGLAEILRIPSKKDDVGRFSALENFSCLGPGTKGVFRHPYLCRH